MTRATKDANDHERNSTHGEPGFSRPSLCRPIQLLERTVEVKQDQKVHGKRRPKKNLGAYMKCLHPDLTFARSTQHLQPSMNRKRRLPLFAIAKLQNLGSSKNARHL